MASLMLRVLLYICICLEVAAGRRRKDFFANVRRPTQGDIRFPDRPNSHSNSNYLDFLCATQAASTTTYAETSPENMQSTQHSSGVWPPWPFNLLSTRSHQQPSSTSTSISTTNHHPSLIVPFLQASTRAALVQTKALASHLWLHAPPAAPPLVLLALIPQRQQQQAAVVQDGGLFVSRRVVPLFANPFVRSLALGGAGLAVMSWAHAQLLRKRLLTPLPLPYKDIHRAILPPFLPDHDNDEDILTLETDTTAKQGLNASAVSKTLRKFLAKPSGITLADWQKMRRQRQAARKHSRRVTIMEQCMALQKLKKQQQGNGKKRPIVSADAALGYALVTGASKGLGRAIAVELARYGMPLILLARDVDRLTALAYDIEACYGVKCCVLQADLTKPGVAESVFEATKKAGLKVDVLVNNAGISSHGNSVDLPLREIDNMIQLNVLSTSTLTHLYGRDMKDRRRGRILMVSSICGAVAGIPTVAVYSATKAFEKTLSISIAKELEKFGVGVTCLLPGAVSETGFRQSSNAQDALCWKIPYHARPPHHVAEAGVRAMLMGDTEVMPGWMNRAFVKVMMPVFPQRLHNWVAEVMWNPIRLPFMRARHEDFSVNEDPPGSAVHDARPSRPHFKFQSPPQLLQIEKPQSSKAAEDTRDQAESKADVPVTEASDGPTGIEGVPRDTASPDKAPPSSTIDKSR